MRRSAIIVFNILLIFILLVLGGRLWIMQVVEGGLYQNKAQANRVRVISSKAIRGVVYDRNSRQLVSNRPIYSVAITPAALPTSKSRQGEVRYMFDYLANMFATSQVITVLADQLPPEQQAAVVAKLVSVLNVSAAELNSKIDGARAGAHAADVLLRRQVPLEQIVQLRALIENDALPGISTMNELEYNLLARQTQPYKPVIVQRDITFEQMRLLEEEHLKLPGVSVVAELARQYADGPIFAHILGYDAPISEEQYAASLPPEGSETAAVYDKDDKVGQLGIEASMEDLLRGQKGYRKVEVNANQRITNELESQDAQAGQNIVLTIDSALQYSVTQALQDGLNQSRAHIGAAVVLNVNTGEVLALVSLPNYDNNLFANGISQADLDTLNNNAYQPMFNNVVSGRFPPGSTFKMITAAAALQEKVIGVNDPLTCPGRIDVPTTWNEQQRNSYPCWQKAGHGALSMVQALAQSCDVYFYQAAGPRQPDELGNYLRFYSPWQRGVPQYFNGLGIDKMNTYMREFGLGQRTGIELPGEAKGVAPDQPYKLQVDPETGYWALGDTLQAAIGQGFDLVTPLQLVNVTAAIANGGTLYKPQIVRQVIASDGGTVLRDFQPQVLRAVRVSAENLAVIRTGMREAVAGARGTAKKINLAGVQVAGKTGTAEFGEPLPELGGVRAANAWFTAFAPYDKPEIAIVVLIKGEAATLEGSTFAVPVARDILKAYFHVEK